MNIYQEDEHNIVFICCEHAVIISGNQSPQHVALQLFMAREALNYGIGVPWLGSKDRAELTGPEAFHNSIELLLCFVRVIRENHHVESYGGENNLPLSDGQLPSNLEPSFSARKWTHF